MGDFNYPSINFNYLSILSSDSQGDKIFVCCTGLLLCATFLWSYKESNILNLILTSDENVIEDLKIIEAIGSRP